MNYNSIHYNLVFYFNAIAVRGRYESYVFYVGLGFHRRGKLEWPDGAVYEGEFEDGSLQGYVSLKIIAL